MTDSISKPPPSKPREPPPGSRWRVLAQDGARSYELRDAGVFDELVVDNWLHIEQMQRAVWWMELGGLHIWIRLRKDGTMRIAIRRTGGGPGGRVSVEPGVSTRGKNIPGEPGATWRAPRSKAPMLMNATKVSGSESAACESSTRRPSRCSKSAY